MLPKMLGPGPGPGPIGRPMGQAHIGPWLGPYMDLPRLIYFFLSLPNTACNFQSTRCLMNFVKSKYHLQITSHTPEGTTRSIQGSRMLA